MFQFQGDNGTVHSPGTEMLLVPPIPIPSLPTFVSTRIFARCSLLAVCQQQSDWDNRPQNVEASLATLVASLSKDSLRLPLLPPGKSGRPSVLELGGMSSKAIPEPQRGNNSDRSMVGEYLPAISATGEAHGQCVSISPTPPPRPVELGGATVYRMGGSRVRAILPSHRHPRVIAPCPCPYFPLHTRTTGLHI
jgi:hypothetical protein